ncbi:MAG: antitoxin [Acidobacteria bacterium]|nr:antitoxin [Acidobacteriota bacterium]
MSKRLEVLMDPEEYREIRGTARRQRITVVEWVRQALRKVRSGSSLTIEAKLRAVAEASRYQFPTADIDVMLRQIEAGDRLR